MWFKLLIIHQKAGGGYKLPDRGLFCPLLTPQERHVCRTMRPPDESILAPQERHVHVSWCSGVSWCSNMPLLRSLRVRGECFFGLHTCRSYEDLRKPKRLLLGRFQNPIIWFHTQFSPLRKPFHCYHGRVKNRFRKSSCHIITTLLDFKT